MALMDARCLTVDILMATANPVRLRVPQPGFDVGVPGAEVVIDGNDVSGSVIPLRGVTAGYVLRKGQFLTIETSGSGRLYQVAAIVVAAADGTVSVPVWPMLHVPPQDGDAVEIGEPWIEGLIDEGGGHEVGLISAAEPESFTIEEPD